MKVCIHFGFSFETHHFSLSSVQKRLMISLKGNWSLRCITAMQKGIISTFTKFKLLGSKELSINIPKYLMAPETWEGFQEGSNVSKQRENCHHTTFHGGQKVKRVLETTEL